MEFNVYQIIGGIIYTIFAFIIGIVVLSSGISAIYVGLIFMVLVSGLLYAGIMLINGVLGALLPYKDREVKKKDEKYILRNDFTDMLNKAPKKKDWFYYNILLLQFD